MTKKTYEKPLVYYERFELSQHVANCAWELNSGENVCGYKGETGLGLDEIGVIINDTTEGCVEREYQAYCYTNGGDGLNLFNS